MALSCEAELAPYLVKEAATPLLAKSTWPAMERHEQRTIDFLVGLNQRVQQSVSYLIRMEPGVQTPEETLAQRQRFLPRLRLAAGAVAAPGLRIGRAFRVGLPDPAQARCEVHRRPQRHRDRLHRPARVVRGVPARRQAGLAWTPPRACWPAKAMCPLACTPQPSSAAPISGAVDECEVSFAHEMAISRVWESPRVHPALHRRASGPMWWRWAARWTPSCKPRMCA